MPVEEYMLNPALLGKINQGYGGGALENRGANAGEYFCDGNARADGDGTSWDEAYKSLANALAYADAQQRLNPNRWWAKRSTVWVCGDLITEDLTKLAEKTDIVGVGSMNQYKKAGILGTHSIEAAGTKHYVGCRMINLHFRDDGATVNFTLPADQNGIEFLGCDFQRNASGTGAIQSTSNNDLRIIGCNFFPDTQPGKFTTAINFGNGLVTNILIKDNFINAGIGIACHITPAFQNCRIEGNTIFATTLTIDDNSDDWYILNNTLVSLAASGGTSGSGAANAIDGNIDLSGNNYLVTSDSNALWPVLDPVS